MWRGGGVGGWLIFTRDLLLWCKCVIICGPANETAMPSGYSGGGSENMHVVGQLETHPQGEGVKERDRQRQKGEIGKGGKKRGRKKKNKEMEDRDGREGGREGGRGREKERARDKESAR